MFIVMANNLKYPALGKTALEGTGTFESGLPESGIFEFVGRNNEDRADVPWGSHRGAEGIRRGGSGGG
jgi:hypothetical protein